MGSINETWRGISHKELRKRIEIHKFMYNISKHKGYYQVPKEKRFIILLWVNMGEAKPL